MWSPARTLGGPRSWGRRKEPPEPQWGQGLCTVSQRAGQLVLFMGRPEEVGTCVDTLSPGPLPLLDLEVWGCSWNHSHLAGAGGLGAAPIQR